MFRIFGQINACPVTPSVYFFRAHCNTHKVDTRLYVTTDYASMDCFGSGVRRREAAVAKKEEGESKRQLSPWRRFTRAHAHCWPVGHLAGWAGPSGFSSRTTALDVVAAAGGAGCLVGRGAA